MNNDLIKEFARQAGFKVNFQHEDHQAIRMAQYREFAELIVRECIECTKVWRDAVRAESTRDYSRGYVHGCNDAIVVMKVRFGVEE